MTDVRRTVPPRPVPHTDDWCALSEGPLPVTEALRWAAMPACGAVVTFCGTVRDHSDGRPEVTSLEYEAYAQEVEPRLARVAAVARERWPVVGRIALLHRVGVLGVSEVAVVVVVSTPSRSEAFEAARFCIDTLKETVPIWKKETWAGGTDWSVGCHPIDAPENHGPHGEAVASGPAGRDAT